MNKYRPTTENWPMHAGYKVVHLSTPAELEVVLGEFDLDISRNQCDANTCPGYHMLTVYQGKIRECNTFQRTVAWILSDTLKSDYAFFDLLQHMDVSALDPSQKEEVKVHTMKSTVFMPVNAGD